MIKTLAVVHSIEKWLAVQINFNLYNAIAALWASLIVEVQFNWLYLLNN